MTTALLRHHLRASNPGVDVVLALINDLPTDLLLLAAVSTGGTYDETLLRRRIRAVDPWVRVAKTLSRDPDVNTTAVTVGNPTAQTAVAGAGGGG